MDIETFKRFVRPGQIFKITDLDRREICGGRLVAIHHDCVEIADYEDDKQIVPLCLFDDCRILFGPGFDKHFGAPETLESLHALIGERLGKHEPALSPDEIERLTASVD